MTAHASLKETRRFARDSREGPTFRIAIQEFLQRPRMQVTINGQEEAMTVRARGAPGFFRLAVDTPTPRSLSANRNSGIYFYENSGLIGKTRRPGSMTRIWLGDARRHFNMECEGGDGVVIMADSRIQARLSFDEKSLLVETSPEAPAVVLLLWLVAALRLETRQREFAAGEERLRRAIRRLSHPRPW